MVAPRRKSRLISRRRRDDEGEDDASLMAGDDSLSEPSVPSDADDDADGEGSEESEVDTPSKGDHAKTSFPDAAGYENGSATTTKKPSTDVATGAHAMINGLTIADGSGDPVDEIDIDDVNEHPHPTVNLPSATGAQAHDKTVSTSERRRREHEEYKKRRDADPAFVPNRGGFFMHDQRHDEQNGYAQGGFRPGPRGKGRGRGGFGAQFAPQHAQPEDGPWKHDLHQTVAGPDLSKPEPAQTAADAVPDHRPKPAPRSSDPVPNRNFSSSTATGVVNCSVFIPGMQTPISFTAVPQNLHVRLPEHRPPLRRDKPVRVSLPGAAPSYIFPAEYRSFIFIPRALRPNQQGFGRPRGRGSMGGPGGMRSGRNSIYGGSTYTPSVAMSRRSSFARDREGMASPAMSAISRVTGPVRGPPGAASAMPPHLYKPAIPTGYPTLPMHQPRPTKSIPMPEVESPGLYPSHGQQPFAYQVPPQYGNDYRPDSRRTSYPSQRGTPLGQIPERAIHAQPFQPPYPGVPQQPHMPAQGFQQGPAPQMYYPAPAYHQQPQPQQPQYYYPQPPGPPQQYQQQVPVPVQPPYGYMPPPMSAPPPPPPPPPPPQPPQQLDANGQPSTVAHESNGTIYYYDQAQMAADAAAAAAAYQGNMMQYGMQPPYMNTTQYYYPPR